jgi:hypothetical protein
LLDIVIALLTGFLEGGRGLSSSSSPGQGVASFQSTFETLTPAFGTPGGFYAPANLSTPTVLQEKIQVTPMQTAYETYRVSSSGSLSATANVQNVGTQTVVSSSNTGAPVGTRVPSAYLVE